MDLEFKKLTDFDRGLMYNILKDAYSFDPRCAQCWDENWRETDDFFFDNPQIAEKYVFVTCLAGEPVGFITWDPRHRPEYVEIGHNGIRTACKGRGFGKAQSPGITYITEFRRRMRTVRYLHSPPSGHSKAGRKGMSKQNIYDDEAFYDSFLTSRSRPVNFNDCIETPILLAMLPDLKGKAILDIGCGMGQHAKRYADMGAKSVLGIDISEKMLAYARAHNGGENIAYRHLAMEELDALDEPFDLVTSSLAFDYVEDFEGLMRSIHRRLKPGGQLVFSMSHPIVTAWDGVYDRYTRTETGERLYANLRNYCREGPRKVNWVVEGYECYHRTVSTLINGMLRAGFILEECQEAHISDEMRERYPDLFGGTVHRPEFIFFRGKNTGEAP